MSWLVGVDVGGTFTDVFAFDPATGRVVVDKVPSTPQDPSRAIVAGLEALRDTHGVPLAQMRRFAHGTTVATNALIQRRGGRLALVATKGFRDLLEIGRQIRPRIYDLQADNPPPLVPRALRLEIEERIGARGETIVPLNDDAIAEVVEDVRALGVDGVAICLLFSFLAPEHERRLKAGLQRALPELFISVSSDVQPEFREYERMSTTVLNAYLQPQVTRYMQHLGQSIGAIAPHAAIGINQSSGGLMSIDRAAAIPVRTALSGPAAGVVGAVASARASTRANVITLDMGGTSTDVCLIRNGKAEMTYGRDVADFPVRLPAIDIHTIGAGGGSIAHFGPDGLLKVGPESAGAVPGPACYGHGGTQATVSDANLVLGRLPEQLIDGGMRLDVAQARAVIAPLAERLGTSVEEAALGIVRIVNANMERAIRAVSIERGHDPRPCALMPFGGAGGLHAVEIARQIGMREVLVPRMPGILCAEGLVVSDLKEAFVATCRQSLDAGTSGLQTRLDELIAQAAAWRTQEGLEAGGERLELAVDMRYVGQNYELSVPAALTASGTLPEPALLASAFHRAHETAYGHHNPMAPIEIVNLRLTAVVPLPKTASPRYLGPPEAHARGERPVWFTPQAPAATSIWRRHELPPGTELAGPAIIEQLDATTVLPPGTRARIDDALNMIVEVGA